MIHLVSLLETAACWDDRRVAIHHGDVTVTYGQLMAQIASFNIQSLGRQQRRPIILPNGINFIVLYYAILKGGKVPVLCNYQYPTAQQEKLLAVAGVGEYHKPSDTAAILFTGGTMGEPKAVEHTYAGIAHAARYIWSLWDLTSDDVVMPVAPMSHIHTFLRGAVAPLLAGCQLVIPERYDPAHILDLIERHRVTVFAGGPPRIYHDLINAVGTQRDLSSVRIWAGGGAAFFDELRALWHEATGSIICDGAGSTEMAPWSANTPHVFRAGSVGRPDPRFATVRILDTDSRVLPPSEIGHLWVAGAHLGRCHGLPRMDSFYRTGDMAYLDEDGFLFLVGRSDDVIRVNGYSAYPAQVEAALASCPGVAAAAVVGVPDAQTGEKVVAFVVPVPGKWMGTALLIKHAKSQVFRHACPLLPDIHLIDALPYLAAPFNKLDRAALRRMADDAAL
jgi:long-chain acyl-CoA synthetase